MKTKLNRPALWVHDAETERYEIYEADSIPPKHQWAYDHILEQDCGSISCGTTVYEVQTTKAD